MGLGVDCKHAVSLSDTLFETENENGELKSKSLGWGELLETVVELRADNAVSVAHVMDLRKFIRFTNRGVEAKQEALGNDVAALSARMDSLAANVNGIAAGMNQLLKLNGCQPIPCPSNFQYGSPSYIIQPGAGGQPDKRKSGFDTE